MAQHRFRRGDAVIYRKSKHGVRPGRRARSIYPAPQGDDYAYCVDKFWRVLAEGPNNTVVVVTRRGKHHVVRQDDLGLRRASLWERLWYGARFPQLTADDHSVTCPAPP